VSATCNSPLCVRRIPEDKWFCGEHRARISRFTWDRITDFTLSAEAYRMAWVQALAETIAA
jgi:hypothetical protein